MPRAGLDPNAVVSAAARLADDAGLENLTLARVAESLGVRSPSLYAHVNGLDDLRERLAVRGAQELAGELAPAAAGRAGRDALRAVAIAYRGYAAAHPGTYAAMQVAPRGPAARMAAEQVVDLVVRSLADYRLAEDEQLHAVRGVRAALHGFVELERVGGFGLPLSVQDSFDRLLDMLDAGLRAVAA